MNSRARPKEWLWVAVAAIIILSLSSLPVLAGRLAQTPQAVFSGAVFDRQDYAVHLAAMQLGARGQWGYQMLFTSEAHPARLVKLGYIFLGRISASLGWGLNLTYEMARLIGGLALMAALYGLLTYLTHSLRLRRAAFITALAGSGVGWLQLMIGWQPDPGISPIDFWLIDSYPFFGIMTLPHFAAVGALILIMGLGIMRHIETRKLAHWLLAAAAGLAIILIQPFSVAIGDLVAAGMILGLAWRRKQLDRRHLLALIGLGVVQAPLLIFNAREIWGDSIWIGLAEQNITRSPEPIYFLLGYGSLIPFAIWGAWLAWRRHNVVGIMAAVWASAALILSYSPTSIQRRFSLDLAIPIGILATFGLWYGVFPRLRLAYRRNPQNKLIKGLVVRRNLLVFLFIFLSLPSTLYLVGGGTLYASLRPGELFDPGTLVQAVDWLAEHADLRDGVMSSARTGLLIPPRTGLRAYIGHPIETIGYRVKLDRVEAFFQPGEMTAEKRLELIRECNCNWVIVGPFEREMGDLEADDLRGSDLAFSNSEVEIYRYRIPADRK